MRQLLPFTIGVFLVTAGILAGYFSYWYVPQTIERQVTQSLSILGFKDISYAQKIESSGKIVFKDLSLDKDGYSKIQRITVTYSTFAFMTNGRRAKSFEIDKMNLTAEMKKDGHFDISGWDNDGSLTTILTLIPAQTVMIDHGSIDMLSERFGGIKLKFDAQINKTDGRPSQIRGRITSVQKKLSFDAKIDGTLSPYGELAIKGPVQGIQISTDNYEIKRFNANMTLQAAPKVTPHITLEGEAGSVLWQGMPLGEVNLSYDGSVENFNLAAEGKTIGLQSVEFSSHINHVNGITQYETSMTPSSVKDLLAYLQSNKILSTAPKLPGYILGIKEPVITVDLKQNPDERINQGVFNVISDDPAFEVAGTYEYNRFEKTITGHFEMPETTTAIEITSGSEDVRDDDENAVVPQASPASSPVKIDISASGDFSLSGWRTSESKLDWSLDIEPNKGAIDYGQLQLQNIRGKISQSSNKENKSTADLSYSLPLKKLIKYRGKISLNLDNPATPFIRDISLGIYGGTVRSNALEMHNGHLPQNIRLKISDISLSDLLKDMRIGGLTMVGQMGGVLPLTLKDHKIIVKGGILQSEGAGIARISPYVSTGIFPGYTTQMKRIRDALENYHYEYFELRFDGDFSGSTMMTLSARGINPDLRDKTPVDLNLQIETPIAALLGHLAR